MMRGFTCAMLAVAAVSGAPLTAQTRPGDGRYPAPLLGAMPVDWCRTYGVDCGQPAADLFCGSQGFDRASAWYWAPMPETIVLGDLRLCAGAPCYALVDVVCTGGAALPDGLVPLKLFWSAPRGDNLLAGTAAAEADALAAGYVFVRIEGYALAAEAPGTVPLWSWFGDGRQDAMAATGVGGPAAAGAGYRQVRIEGWVYPTQVAGTVPLGNWWNAAREDNFQTATAAGEADARASGYGFAWVEGYVFPP